MKGMILVAAVTMAGTAIAQEPESSCPQLLGTTPGWAQTGPYQIDGYGSKVARASGLPNCEVAMYHLGEMVASANGGVIWEITQEDGTYAVQLRPAY